ncbi:MAG: hypothetical protein A2V86_15405 [Deltaproteobacteria bacterium RBG_16_49_23]|nr:MAG: hypothetical protein A2V86_15405 [Deltaproteobacteria bacterium RBG_16_49_23]
MRGQHADELLAFEGDHVWVNKNIGFLLEKYPDQWIAVKDGHVIASDPDLMGLAQKIPDPRRTCIEFISTESLEMVL